MFLIIKKIHDLYYIISFRSISSFSFLLKIFNSLIETNLLKKKKVRKEKIVSEQEVHNSKRKTISTIYWGKTIFLLKLYINFKLSLKFVFVVNFVHKFSHFD